MALLPLLATSDEVRASGSSRIEIYFYGPVLVQVIDKEGRLTGRDLVTGQIMNGVPGSRMVQEQTRERMPGWTIHFSDPVPGIYRIQVKGTGPGGFAIDVDTVDASGQVKNSNIFRRIKEGEYMELFFTYSEDKTGRYNTLEMVPE